MDLLVKDYLSEFVEFDKATGIYKAKNKTPLHTNTRGLINRRLNEWANPKDMTLDDFSAENSS